MITFAVIHCNRLWYLKNCVSSILEFVGLDGIDLLIIDNGSSENGVHEYLSSLPSEIVIHEFSKRCSNELHRSMNFAIDFSNKKNNEVVNFIQDDYQYLFSNYKLLSLVYDAFKKDSSVVQLQSNMGWKRKIKKLGKYSSIYINGTQWYKMHSKPPCDNGFTRVSLFNKIGLYPEHTSVHGREKGFISGESWFKRKCKGMKRMMLAEPNMGMLFDCAYVRGNKRIGRYIPPVKKYYLRPIDNAGQQKIRQTALRREMCFIEDFVVADGWKPETHGKHSLREDFILV